MKPVLVKLTKLTIEVDIKEYTYLDFREDVRKRTHIKNNTRVWFNIWRQVAKNVKENYEAR